MRTEQTADRTASAAAGAMPAATARRPHGDARHIAGFVLVLSATFLAANALVCLTWAKFFSLPHWPLWQVIPALLALSFIGATMLSYRYCGRWLQVLYTLSACWLGFLNFFIFASLACWLIRGAAWLAGWPLDLPRLALGVFGAGVLLALYGFVQAAFPRIRRAEVELRNLPATWEGRTVALITDLHLGLLRGPGFLRRVLAQLEQTHPDAVLVSGDMFDGSILNLEYLVEGWRDFSAPRGNFFVTGNHDEFMDREAVLSAVSSVGIRVLRNEKVLVDGLQIVGVHDSEITHPARLDTLLHRMGLEQNAPSILLAHRPEKLPIVRQAGISLQVSGHTHGGQFWPWNLVVRRIYREFGHGLHRLGPLQVYTSYGVGTWGPPLRVGTCSEIALLRLVRQQDQQS